jgi:hypothetical protein
MKARVSTMYLSTILLLVLMLFVSGQASAQTQQLRLDDLTKKAEVIVVGIVTDVRSEWNSDRTRIITKVSLDVDKYLKGETPGRTIVITHPGGEVGGVGELYSHTPSFAKGEEVFLFARKDSKNNLSIAGGNEGKFKVTKNELTGEKMVPGGMTLKMFTSRVLNILGQQEMK